ncbi:ArsR/SmtB family transcription factor [Streptacidiphilus sp. EB103A]|jgi:ArsR family transcriptional regulator|uniref:ArsR/SmtB family transcription factor n=1 Tax=Streptacidiphilus sp. EB103A TaxID=3156275 RepID=UPI003516074F
MPTRLHQLKAELFRMLGHPVRIELLELLLDGAKPVYDLVADIGVEPPNLSQQLALLRRSGLVFSTRQGSTVVYTLADGEVTELLRSTRRILLSLLADRDGSLEPLHQADAERRATTRA